MTTDAVTEAMVEAAARAMMEVRAIPPRGDRDFPVLSLDPDFDDLPRDHTEGSEDNEITQEAVLKLARAALEAAAPVRLADDPGEMEREEDDRFENEFREAQRVAGVHGSMEPYARVLSGRLRAMDKRSRASNRRADREQARADALAHELRTIKSAIRAADATTRAYNGDTVLLIDGDKMEALRRMAGLRSGGGDV